MLPKFWSSVGSVSLALLVLSSLGFHTHLLDYFLLTISLILLARFVMVLYVKRRISVDLLMGSAALVTWHLHTIFEGFLILTLYSASELIEVWSERYARRKLTGLKELLPTEITVLFNGELVSKPLNKVGVGDVILVKPGEVVPADGIVIEGESTFNTSYVTGEPEPVLLKKGDSVVSGYINRDEMIKVRVLRNPNESLLQLLVTESEKALRRKASLQRFIEKFSQPYTLLVLSIFASALLVINPYRALSIILAGCPSAFIITTSTSTALSLAFLARRSVVVRGGRVLEAARGLEALIIDKTGTITLGEMRIKSIKPLSGVSEEYVIKYAGGAAKASDHPVSRALAKLSDLTPSRAKEFVGKGLEALVEGRKVYLGSRAFIKELGFDTDYLFCNTNDTEVLVVIDGALAGAVCLNEALSEGIKEVIESLRKEGLQIIIASGDRAGRVKEIANYLGIKEWFSELRPEDKRKLVSELKGRFNGVGFVGDGINDLEAIAEADVGIAIGSLRTVSDIGDVVLLKGIKSLPLLLRHSKKYMKSIKSSIALALALKLAIMCLGILGLVPLWLVVGVGDDGATLAALGGIAFILSKT